MNRERAALVLLAIFGVGSRLLFLHFFPSEPYYDSLQLIHFGELIRDQGLAARGWYWAQFNPGLPVLLAALFKTGLSPIPLARTATAVATGLTALLPFLIWRQVVSFPWRVVAGGLLALWPGQVFVSGVVLQDNWVLLPTIALACLAVRRLRDPAARGRPLTSALLYGAGLAIRQEMAIVLIPLALVAGTPPAGSGSRRRDLARFGIPVVVILLALAAQRRLATGRLTIATDHGALGLFGSFMPGASGPGWIDARAYAAALEPDLPRGLFGSPSQLVRLTFDEIRRRPLFHAARVAAWLPRLALNADADDLAWSLGNPRSVPEPAREAAERFAHRWAPLLRIELALVQGGFLAALWIAWRRRRLDILVLAAAVALKFAIHMLVSPLGRLVLPAIAVELLVLALAGEALSRRPGRERLGAAALAVGAAAVLLFATPLLADAIIRRDPSDLPGVRAFALDAGDGCILRCELAHGRLAGLSPTTAWIGGRQARVDCLVPTLDPDASLGLRIEGAASVSTEIREGSRAESGRVALGSPGLQPPRRVSVTAAPDCMTVSLTPVLSRQP